MTAAWLFLAAITEAGRGWALMSMSMSQMRAAVFTVNAASCYSMAVNGYRWATRPTLPAIRGGYVVGGAGVATSPPVVTHVWDTRSAARDAFKQYTRIPLLVPTLLTRPHWFRRLELDGYTEAIGDAFEAGSVQWYVAIFGRPA